MEDLAPDNYISQKLHLTFGGYEKLPDQREGNLGVTTEGSGTSYPLLSERRFGISIFHF